MVGGDRGRAEDAAQEALVRVYQRWSRLRDPLAYARRTVVNATRDDWRRTQRAAHAYEQVGVPERDRVENVETSVLRRDELIGALARLPHRQRAGCSRTRIAPPSLTGSPIASASFGSPHVEDTAYVVRRVTANLADDAGNGLVAHSVDYASGRLTRSGSVLDPGYRVDEQYTYTAADGTDYEHMQSFNRDGSPHLTASDSEPGGTGRGA